MTTFFTLARLRGAPDTDGGIRGDVSGTVDMSEISDITCRCAGRRLPRARLPRAPPPARDADGRTAERRGPGGRVRPEPAGGGRASRGAAARGPRPRRARRATPALPPRVRTTRCRQRL